MTFDPLASPEDLREATRKPPKPEDIHVQRYKGEMKHSRRMPRYKRKELFHELFFGFDPLTVDQPPPPPEVEVAFDDVFAAVRDAGGTAVRLFWHPHFRRWGAFQELKEGYWECFSLFHQAPIEDVLPSDLPDRHYEHLRGMIGERRLPGRRDFEILRSFWNRDTTPEEQDALFAVPEEQTENEAEDQMQAQEADLLDYYWNYVWRSANRGRRGYSIILSEDNRASPETHMEVRRLGYSVRARLGTLAAEELLKEVENGVVHKDLRDEFRDKRRLHEAAKAAQQSAR